MGEEATTREIVALRAEYDARLMALSSEVAALRRARPRPRRRWLALVPLACLFALVPLALNAAAPFGDLNPGSVHNAGIEALYDAGITTGCVPNVAYCPNDTVTREQMATFLARAAGLGTNPPVTNAKTATSAGRLGVAPTGTSTYAANELIRVAGAAGQNLFDQNELAITATYPGATYQTVVKVALTAPGAGYILVSGSVVMGAEGANSAGFVRLRDEATNTASPPLYIGTSTGAQTATLSPTFVFPVSAGARSFVLEAQKSVNGTVVAFNGAITAIFVPFGATGAGQP